MLHCVMSSSLCCVVPKACEYQHDFKDKILQKAQPDKYREVRQTRREAADCVVGS